ncbi:hypothetical protein A3K48_02645 [candidate division WOR-1 bacterium RIFOXYA12_FULL_52_29]|uniref:Glycosyltransferase RgtA/B/C/D-like domain-containing protein n=1 Tax=candidate division WOR-1 bacterium RIFOXYC12_FULL_54_18 TaxID=1802584 RepID=A0A1F4T5R9_UNCSA|nr:MAG: hypothetical protein A3K44_02645 [candidate division WOR-1 bacterium RIFOXYA2_FULL_51_19]OGC17473.1 MAG: hypothetical protein A3K48_02645 [candidate division WOR-1 bacterium RIFOXYA12_FULL_52_29]OGC27890.1 MAG: hypothetical protein A3K49_02645 [candidate division WOR-1 bacterium RIFOXYC12_FULL_54_18]OGC29822.1 MAG: hypothetical protein A2346_03690 [candidate division WOR-1 bacterium RIFOXYB12_FULL_52_16]
MVPLLLGFSATSLLIREKIAFLERASLAWGIGLGLMGIEMYTMSLLGISLNLRNVLVPTIGIIGLLLSYSFYHRNSLSSPAENQRQYRRGFLELPQGLNNAEKLLIILIGLTIAYVFFDALVKPTVEFDAMWRQGTIAKIIFTTGQVATEQAKAVAGPHPYLNPLAQAWIYMSLGYWDDALGKVIFPLCFTSMLFIFYCRLRAQTSRLKALIFTYLLTSFPLIILHSGNAYSDLMQTFYYSAGAIYLLSWFKENKTHLLFSSAILFGIGNFVKQSGIPLWGMSVVVLAIFLLFERPKESWNGLKSLGLAAMISAPWIFSPNSFLYGFISSIATRLSPSAPTNAPLVSGGIAAQPANPALADLVYHLGRRMFTYADWQILWFVFIVVSVLGAKLIWQSYLKYGFILIVANLAMIIYAFSSPGTYQYLVDGTLVNRLMMYQIPFVLYFCAIIITLDASKDEPAVKIKGKKKRVR